MKNINPEIYSKIKNRIISYIANIRNLFSPSKLFKTLLYHVYFYQLVSKNIKKIHLGPGNKKIKGFFGVDTYPFVRSDVIGGINKLKFKSGSIKIIHNSHILEHIQRKNTIKVLKEWFRVLEPGGDLYVCVPDLEMLFELYLKGIKENSTVEERTIANKFIGVIYGGQSNKYDFHYNGFSFFTLRDLLISIGFKNVEIFDYKKVDFLEGVNDGSSASFNGRSISLNVKATK